jgi:phosphoglycerol transferase MdoB-like AlkP superfamily enzyme
MDDKKKHASNVAPFTHIMLNFPTMIYFTTLPLFFLIIFLFYFGLVSFKIYSGYDSFKINTFEIFLYLPRLFQNAFISFGLFGLFFGCLKELTKRFNIIFYPFIIIMFIIYMVQYFALYYTNHYLIPEAFFHVDQISLIVDGSIIAATASFAFLIVAAGVAAVRFINKYRVVFKKIGRLRSLYIQILVTSALFVICHALSTHTSKYPDIENFYGIRSESPEIALATTARNLFSVSESFDTATLPDEANKFLGEKFGMFYSPKMIYPQVKNWIYRHPIPFKKRNDTIRKPNVILFFIESLSANLLSTYGSKVHTPNMDDFAGHGMVVHGYYNHTFPTICGLRGQLCSFYPTLSEFMHSEHNLVNIKLLGLPHVLNDYGYKTVFFSYSPALPSVMTSYTTNMKKLMEECGFSELLMAEDIQKSLLGLKNLEGYQFKNSVNDRGMMVNLVNYLKEYNNEKSPFFLAVSTVGTHPGLDDDDGKLKTDMQYLDIAFGKFWSYFKTSKFYDNTIVVLTADHAIPPTVQYKKLIGDMAHPNYFFGEIACIIFDQRYHLPKRFKTKASSIDLVPSILQLIEINDIQNPFLGLSIFSDRKHYPSLLCTMMDAYYVHSDRGIQHFSYHQEPDFFEKYNHNKNDIFLDPTKQMLAVKIWFQYNKMLNLSNRVWSKTLEKK